MRIAIVSDIHGNLRALEAVLADLKKQAPDLVIHGGDLVANGSRPREVFDLVQQQGWAGVMGNTDEMLWRPDQFDQIAGTDPSRAELRRVLVEEMGPWCVGQLGDARVAELKKLPASISHHGIYLCHASPGSLWTSPRANSSDEEFLKFFGGVKEELIVFCHIHHALVRQIGSQTFVNTGSLSLSYDGDWRASYAIIDNGRPVLRRVEYDLEAEARELETAAIPYGAWMAQLLRTGTYCPPFRASGAA